MDRPPLSIERLYKYLTYEEAIATFKSKGHDTLSANKLWAHAVLDNIGEFIDTKGPDGALRIAVLVSQTTLYD